ncbi:MAG: hypothetical protein KBD21_02185 [Candidatus Pacebacteria bacterium]|nr:hypothetical protein [Candidatus Paceibacterota bacterium]
MNKLSAMVAAVSVLLGNAAQAADFPMGYPYLSWGELSYAESSQGVEEGLKLDGYFEQGVDLFPLGTWRLNAFAALRGTVSESSDDYWNNKVGPWVGLKLKYDGTAPGSGWSNLAVGVRMEHYTYFDSVVPDDTRFLLFAQWGLGGDWRSK